MTTQERYERYNEVTFEAYIKAAIDYAIARYRKQKAKQTENEVYLADLPDYWAARPSEELTAIDSGSVSATFEVDGISVDVHDPDLVKALRFLVPQKRDILLLAYFLGKSDAEIGKELNISKSTAQRRRASALQRMKRQICNEK